MATTPPGIDFKVKGSVDSSFNASIAAAVAGASQAATSSKTWAQTLKDLLSAIKSGKVSLADLTSEQRLTVAATQSAVSANKDLKSACEALLRQGVTPLAQRFKELTEAQKQNKQATNESATAAQATDNQLGFQNALTNGIQVLDKVSAGLSQLSGELNRAGDAADSLADKAKGAFGEAGDSVAKLAQQQIVLGFDDKEIMLALQRLNKGGLEPTQENLTILEDISARTGGGVSELAQKFAELDRNTDPKSVKALQKEIGATTDALAALGAKTEGAKVLTDTAERAEAARRALLAFSENKFKGAAEDAADEAQRLSGEFELLKREVGSGSIELQEKFAPALRSVVGQLRGVSPELKGFVGATVEVTTRLAAFGLGALGVGAQLAILASNAQAVALAQSALATATAAANSVLAVMAGTLGLVVAVAGSAAIGIAALTFAINEETRANEEALKIDELRAQSLGKSKDLVGKSAEELRVLGKTSKDVAAILGGLQDQAEEAVGLGTLSLSPN